MNKKRQMLYFKVFGYWRVLSHGPPQHWDCICKCGTRKIVREDGLLSGRSQSCGCWGRLQWSKQTKERNTTHGLSKVPIYHIWKEMRARCARNTHCRYKDYGGRGIRVCPPWLNPETFITWARENGYRKGLVIDRIDNDGNYEPSNCRFVTYAVSNANKRTRKDSKK